MKVKKGWVTRTGTVDWQFQRVAAESAVRQLSGVVGVSNLIEVRPKVAPRDVKQKILDALKRNAGLEVDAIRVNVVEGKVVPSRVAPALGNCLLPIVSLSRHQQRTGQLAAALLA